MAMALKDPEKDGFPTILADWLELRALQEADRKVTILEIKDVLDLEGGSSEESEEPSEHVGPIDMAAPAISQDMQEEDDQIDDIINDVVEEIEHRQKALGDSYPFQLEDGGYTLSLTTQRTFGGSVYLFCLAISNNPAEGLIESVNGAKFITSVERDLFQICATLGAAGVNRGPAISIGFPRPDKSGFLEKLKASHEHFDPMIVVRTAAPTGSPQRVKDGAIDVLSWTPEKDGRGGIRYFLGQAASGKGWREKSAKTEIDAFCNLWFSTTPPDPSAQMFIPFCVEGDFSAEEDFQTCVEKEVDTQTRRLGFLCYRHRLPSYANAALSLDIDILNRVERIAEKDKIVAWVENFIESAGT
jgi:hypothetical protein